MKVTLFMAMSANGMVARTNGDEDFLSNENWKVFTGLAKKHGCFIWGRKTYEAVKKWGKQYDPEKLGSLPMIISKNLQNNKFKKYLVANSPHTALAKLSARGYRAALLSGGPTLNSAFARAGLINEVILAVNPVVVGDGKALFLPRHFDLQLKLTSIKKRKNLLLLSYKVLTSG